jgi:hypothetical protein
MDFTCADCGWKLGGLEEGAKGDTLAEGYSVARTVHFRRGQVVARCGKCKGETTLPLQVRVVFGQGGADPPPAPSPS